jgi:phytoene dehydrogenase-like protein
MHETLAHPLDRPSYADILIVGGGLSGLAAATYAARSGRSVTLFEKASQTGGRAMTKQSNGFSLNLGAHALYYQTEAGEVLRELGVAYSGKQPPTSYALAHDQLHLVPRTPLDLKRTTLFDVPAKLELVRLQAAILSVNTHTLEQVSLSEWLRQHVRHPQLRALFLMFARTTTYSNAPEIQSAALFVALLRKIPKVLYLDDGWQTLVDGLRVAAEHAGVRIITGARVAAIEHEELVQGVRLANGEFYAAKAVIVATDPTGASELVDHGEHTALSRWAREAVPSYVACLDVGLRRLPEPRHLSAVSIERPLYMVVHSASAKLAPQEGALIHTIRYLEPGERADPEVSEQELEALLDRVQPGWREEVVERQFLPHMKATNAIVQPRSGGLSGRPGPEVPGIHNLYVAGDWVGLAGQLTAAGLASARQAASLAYQQTASVRITHEAEHSFVRE